MDIVFWSHTSELQCIAPDGIQILTVGLRNMW